MKFAILYIALLISAGIYGQTQITPDDLKTVIGSWEGTITYLDYQTNKPFTMTANLIVEQGNNEYSLVLNNIYPNEPKANGKDKIKIAKNGLLLNKNKVTSRKELENGQTRIQTENTGEDDNKKALIRYTYIFGSDLLIIRKEVQFDKTEDWIKRSEFNYTRKN